MQVPDYCGPTVYPGEPTWVPLLPAFTTKEGTRMTRCQFPVVAGFALTVNKAQGLTIKEGVVIHLVGGKKFRPAAKHGLPLVAWTRSESFAMTAFKNLPPAERLRQGPRLRHAAHALGLHRQTAGTTRTNPGQAHGDDNARPRSASSRALG